MKARVLLFCGTHLRHLYFMRSISELDMEFSAIVMQREDPSPHPPKWANDLDREIFKLHFDERTRVEHKHFSHPEPLAFLDNIPTLHVRPESLNTQTTLGFLRSVDPDVVIVFGADLIKSPLLEALPDFSINLHLGLSPWYRGAATLFWPFYFLEPNFAGATFHSITASPDAGPILHQSVPPLRPEDGIHDVGAKVVTTATTEFKTLLEDYSKFRSLSFIPQKAQGKLFSRFDFRPSHLRLIYEEFGNEIVREYLEGSLTQRNPLLVRARD